jgi:carbamate kinase
MPPDSRCATLLTQIEVDPKDPAFKQSTKPIGPVYSKTEAQRLAKERGWSIAPDGASYRRVVPSPQPKRIYELRVIEQLVSQGVTVICAGGGGIPVISRKDGSLVGIEAVIDKDLASALLARELKADAFLLLTDVDAVYRDWGTKAAKAIRLISPWALARLPFEVGTMAPKVEAACDFVECTGRIAGIGQLRDASAILRGKAGTLINSDASVDIGWGTSLL